MWKNLIRKTFEKRGEKTQRKDDPVIMEFEVKRKGILWTLIDDHRDAAMFRHALVDVYLKLSGKNSGRTPHYKDETGMVNLIFREVHRLRGHIDELEAKVKKYEEKGACLR